jgi:MoxR-like ATPase
VGLEDLSGYILYGASPRGTIHLIEAARAFAYLRGRSYVLPEDVIDLAPDVLRHRIVLSYEALAEEVSPDQIIRRFLQRIPAPERPMEAHAPVGART